MLGVAAGQSAGDVRPWGGGGAEDNNHLCGRGRSYSQWRHVTRDRSPHSVERTNMTISYQRDVASSTAGGFTRILFKWKEGSLSPSQAEAAAELTADSCDIIPSRVTFSRINIS